MTASQKAGRKAASATNKERKRARKAGELITVTAPVSLALATKSKQAALRAVLRESRSCINRYIKVCWKHPHLGLDAATLNLVPGGSLSYRHRQNALKVALETIVSCQKSAAALGVRPSRPHYGVNSAVPLSSLVCAVEKGKGSFDYVVKVASLIKRKPIKIPVKGTTRLNHWLQTSTLLNSVTITGDMAALQINVKLDPMRPGTSPESENIIGVDLGYLKLLATSNGDFHGTQMKAVTDRVARAKPGSKGRLRARRARTHYINRQVNELPWDKISVIGIEDLKGIKQGKKPNRGKGFRKKMAPWVHRQAVKRIEFKANVNRVQVVTVDPRNTSRTCPSCGKVAKENRRGEVFRCVQCNYTMDADTVGAMIVLARTRQQLRAVYGRSASSV